MKDLKQRGLLADTLVIWGGEFGVPHAHGREPRQDRPQRHHVATPSPCGSPAAASSPAKPSAKPTSSASTPRPTAPTSTTWHATILHLLGPGRLKLTFKFQGRNFRRARVAGDVIHKLIA